MTPLYVEMLLLLVACHVTVAASTGTAPVNGGWSGWTQWSSCTSPYDDRTRKRQCSHPPPSGLGQDCIGLHVETSPCSDMYPSLVPGKWAQWNQWEPCSVTCSVGIQQRSRDCVKPSTFTCQRCIPTCTGDVHETQTCNTACPSNYRDCGEIKRDDASSTTGVYSIRLFQLNKQVDVWCDMDSSEGTTVFQKRSNRSVDFYHSFTEYINGFGTPPGDYWLGLDAIHELTTLKQRKLIVRLTDQSDHHYNDTYDNFSITPGPDYTLSLDTGTHSQGDGMTGNNGCKFSTFDRDQDKQPMENCAENFHGAWWYETCGKNNLNGQIFEGRKPAYFANGHFFLQLKASQMGLQ